MDLAFESVGSREKFQKILAFLVILVTPLIYTTTTIFPFMLKRPDFQCKNKGDPTDNFHICPEKDLCQDNLFEYKIIESTSLKNWASEYQLYCSKSYYNQLYRSTFYLASMVGNPLILPLADQYGRKIMFNGILIVLFVLILNIYYAINEWHILFVHLVMGLISFSVSLTSIIITEFIDKELKSTIITMCNISIALCSMLYSLYFWLVDDWKLLIFIHTALALLCLIIGQKYLLESPRWLNSQNKFEETLDVLKEIAKINNSEENFNKFLSVNEGIFYKQTFIKSFIL